MDHLDFFKFVGRVVGKALFDGQSLDAYFTRSFYKHMLGQRLNYQVRCCALAVDVLLQAAVYAVLPVPGRLLRPQLPHAHACQRLDIQNVELSLEVGAEDVSWPCMTTRPHL